MHYVALSRLRNISELHILNLNENEITVSKKVQEEITRLREDALLNSHLPFLYKDTTGTFKIFQNVRSLHLHFPDVASDYNVIAADVNIFVETALCSSDNNDLYQIPSFQLFRNDFISHGTRTPYGTAVYVQENVQLLNRTSNFLDDPYVPVILLGDFNINLMENTSEKNSLTRYLTKEKQYVQCISQVTTDYKTQTITSIQIFMKE